MDVINGANLVNGASAAADQTPGAPSSAPLTGPAQLEFALADPDHRLAGVRLWQEVGIPGEHLELTWRDGTWRTVVPRPAAWRMEYLFELTHADGGRELVPDPANPLRIGSAFGDHSELRLPGYRSPEWLALPAPDGHRDDLVVDPEHTGLDRPVQAQIWSCAGLAAEESAPLLVVHDGPEYDILAGLTHYLAAMVATGRIPRLRALLLHPGDRDRWYSAHPEYARALATQVVPATRRRYPTSRTVGMGTSLGALAWLYAQRRHPELADGLFLQSGSFFTPELDPQERGFSGFGPVVDAVARLHRAEPAGRPVPVRMTCGSVEENLANNRAAEQTLRAQGYDVRLSLLPDGHNYTAWRDAFDPPLAELLALVGAAQAQAHEGQGVVEGLDEGVDEGVDEEQEVTG